MMKKTYVILVFLLVFFLGTFYASALSDSHDSAVIYYNEACTMCAMYVKNELIPTLEENGITNIIKKDYVNEKKNRVELNELNKKWNIPPQLQGHFMTFIGDDIVLGGHVPAHIIDDLLNDNLSIEKILVLQDEMSDAVSYTAWGFKGEAKEYDIDAPISEYVTWFDDNKENLKEPEDFSASWDISKLLPLILISGILDGINPCAFAVLIFFVAFLFTLKRTKADILKVGFVYILMIYIAYLLIGLGIVHAFIFTGQEHLMAKISAYLLILLGLVNIKDYFWYGKGFSLSPKISMNFYKRWISKLTIPSVMLIGFLVGLCTFPCSGGIYVAILGLLAAKTTYMSGIYYMLIYNLMFVLPLIVTLFFLTNRRVLGRISRWENSQKRWLKLITGLVMILIGIVILLWFI